MCAMISITPPYFILTGPPGAGKTAVLDVLAKAINTVPEPARRVLSHQRQISGTATGDQDPAAFVEQMRALAVSDFASAQGPTVFDRGLPDLLGYCAHYKISDAQVRDAVAAHRYRSPVFVFPPWPEIYQTDQERRLDAEGAQAFGALTRSAYLQTGYDLIDVPKDTPAQRAAFILAHING